MNIIFAFIVLLKKFVPLLIVGIKTHIFYIYETVLFIYSKHYLLILRLYRRKFKND